MKNNLLTKIKKNFTKKDASYLIVIGVLSGLFVGSLIHNGPKSFDRHEMRDRENISFEQKGKGFDRGHHGEFFWHDENLMPEITPSPTPTASSSSTPSA